VLSLNLAELEMNDNSIRKKDNVILLNQPDLSNESIGCTQPKTNSNSSPEEHIQNGTAGDTTPLVKVPWSSPDSKVQIYLLTSRT